MHNVLSLHRDLVDKTYCHCPYEAFRISDPKPRDIYKASVRDRLLHHAVYRKLYEVFDRVFIADSFSCRVGKGTHRAMDRFRIFAGKESHNHTRTTWVLKCDIRKFFVNIDHYILLDLVARRIADGDIRSLLAEIIGSFNSGKEGIGLPLGNLTSQLLANVYMNELDQFVKNGLREKYYIRYADDFVVLSESRTHLESLVPKITAFLHERLRLELYPDKLFIKTIASGVDFLGWVHFLDHRVLRTTTKKRMVRGISGECNNAVIASYRGMLSHGNAKKLEKRYFGRSARDLT